MKIIIYPNTKLFSKECLDKLRKMAAVFTPIRGVINHRGADWTVRVSNPSLIDDIEFININITDPNIFCPHYFMLSRMRPAIKEQIDAVKAHFGRPEQVEVDMDGLRIIVSTPTENPMDAKIIGARVVDLKEVMDLMPSNDILKVKELAAEKAKQYFENKDELV